jgi:hypothetical protein
VPREERLGAQGVLLPEQTGVGPREDPRAEAAPQQVADLVPDHGGDEDAGGQRPERQRDDVRGDQGTGQEEQRVTGQEEPGEQPRLGEDDRHHQQHSERAERVEERGQDRGHGPTVGPPT